MKKLPDQCTHIALNLDHLDTLVRQAIARYGDECDLNHIDVSRVTDMESLFNGSFFNGSIEKWDVSNVLNMNFMFQSSYFKGDLSEWNVSSVLSMKGMFKNSYFNGELSKWNVSNVRDMHEMFNDALFDRPIKYWNTANVENMQRMFYGSVFKQNISKWDLSAATKLEDMIDEYILPRMSEPTAYHWFALLHKLIEPHKLAPPIVCHYDTYKSLVESLFLDDQKAAIEMHKRWIKKPMMDFNTELSIPEEFMDQPYY